MKSPQRVYGVFTPLRNFMRSEPTPTPGRPRTQLGTKKKLALRSLATACSAPSARLENKNATANPKPDSGNRNSPLRKRSTIGGVEEGLGGVELPCDRPAVLP